MKGVYTVTLDTEVVDKAKELSQDSGGKLSPLINSLLKKWSREQNHSDVTPKKIIKQEVENELIRLD